MDMSSAASQHTIRNRLLLAMGPDDFALLQPDLEPVTLKPRDPLNEPNHPTRFVYFLDNGVGSVVLGPERAIGVEVGIVGREGLLGTSVVLGALQSPNSTFIQLAGTGWRIEAGALRAAMATSPSLQGILLRYIHTVLVQTASTAHANADYLVEERTARWILMCHDRTDGDDIAITHEFLALLLGVRRPGVTVATHFLEGEGMIRARRGLITVLNRDKLKTKANGSYGLAEAEYERLIGSSGHEAGANVVQLASVRR
jgi:CRP-like cAMP-binding protein